MATTVSYDGWDEAGRALELRLPPLIAGQDKPCLAVTEPDVGHNTTE